MAKDGQLARIASRPAPAEPGLAELLDPIALEERLRAARARRAEALAQRPRAEAPATATAPETPPRPAPEAPPPPPQPVMAPRSRTALAIPLLIFLAGLGLGGALVAVLALRALPERVALAPATTPEPAASPAPVPAVPPAAPTVVTATAPVIAASPPAPSATPETPPATPSASPPAPAHLAEPARETAPPDTGAAPPLAEAAPPPAGPAPLPAQVIIHFPASASASAAEARDTLVAAGVERVEIVPVRYAIGRSNIRFYHDADRAPAEALAPIVGPALEGGTPEARDFTDYATPPAPGKVEIWLAGDPGASRRAARSPAAPGLPAPPSDAPAPGLRAADPFAPPASQAEQVERILIDRLRRAR